VQLHGESFAFEPVEAWPAGSEFRPFDTRSWRRADFAHGKDFFTIHNPSPR